MRADDVRSGWWCSADAGVEEFEDGVPLGLGDEALDGIVAGGREVLPCRGSDLDVALQTGPASTPETSRTR